MPLHGPLSHIDLSVSDPDRSIPFYAALLEGVGFRRMPVDLPDFQGERPRRACWLLPYPGGGLLGIEVRPASGPARDRPYDRYAPGPHHLAFHAGSRKAVDDVHAKVHALGGTVLDAPADYSGQRGYTDGYYAVFFADPDGVKLEVVHDPVCNP
ncbi:VOC family protein [Myxococcota bacterium]|nr:VOC family protein [Myxococcota bacterium]MCZ7618681.1 VOC family protein [Myxococcota bacterium]